MTGESMYYTVYYTPSSRVDLHSDFAALHESYFRT